MWDPNVDGALSLMQSSSFFLDWFIHKDKSILLERWQKIKNIFVSMVNLLHVRGVGGCVRECTWRGRRDNMGKTVRARKCLETRNRACRGQGACSTGGSVFANTLNWIFAEAFCIRAVLLFWPPRTLLQGTLSWRFTLRIYANKRSRYCIHHRSKFRERGRETSPQRLWGLQLV